MKTAEKKSHQMEIISGLIDEAGCDRRRCLTEQRCSAVCFLEVTVFFYGDELLNGATRSKLCTAPPVFSTARRGPAAVSHPACNVTL